jgi:hypothetical protein
MVVMELQQQAQKASFGQLPSNSANAKNCSTLQQVVSAKH